MSHYLHPFRDSNGRTGRLLSNFILLWANHPLLIFELKDRATYISDLKQIRIEGTDEHLIDFFIRTAITRMKSELAQKHKNSLPTLFFWIDCFSINHIFPLFNATVYRS